MEKLSICYYKMVVKGDNTVRSIEKQKEVYKKEEDNILDFFYKNAKGDYYYNRDLEKEYILFNVKLNGNTLEINNLLEYKDNAIIKVYLIRNKNSWFKSLMENYYIDSIEEIDYMYKYIHNEKDLEYKISTFLKYDNEYSDYYDYIRKKERQMKLDAYMEYGYEEDEYDNYDEGPYYHSYEYQYSSLEDKMKYWCHHLKEGANYLKEILIKKVKLIDYLDKAETNNMISVINNSIFDTSIETTEYGEELTNNIMKLIEMYN